MAREYCNPLNIEYKFQHYGKWAHREAADPTMVLFKGKYYLFASMSAGFYWSEDLIHWTWHENRELDMYRYAPDAHVVGDWLYFCASTRGIPSTFWRTQDPLSDRFEKVAEPFAFWDPAFFADDDGRFYLYQGCGNSPLDGVELDPVTMQPKGEKVIVVRSDIARHGWERYKGEGIQAEKANSFATAVLVPLFNPKGLPFMEGCFMNKIGGTYYLQYAAPGTERNLYGNGVYIGDGPLGPFRFQTHNPFSLVPTGFITGAGHGSTMEDTYGNLWHIATMRIGVHQYFERRLGLFPAGVDEDGILFCNQNFADYPIILPEGKFDPKKLQPHYMLLSYKKKGTASSTLKGHDPALALNENIRNWWCAQGSAGEWYQVDLGKVYTVHSIQLNLAEEGIPVQKYLKTVRSTDISSNHRYTESGNDFHTRYIMEGSLDGSHWFVLKDASATDADLTHDYVVLPEDRRLRYVKVTALELPYGHKFAISGLRVFGLDNGEKPAAVTHLSRKRTGPMNATLQWKAVSGAIGYNVRYGIAPDKLYTSFLLYDQCDLHLTTLNADTEYWACVDSFNESGITEGCVLQLP